MTAPPDKYTPLTSDQMNFVIGAVTKWLSIKEENRLSTNTPDPHHSGLLWRLLDGKEALEKPPPRSFSCPNYSLGEGKPTRILELHEIHGTVDPLTLRNQVAVDQDSRWVWGNDEKTILKFLPTGELYKYYITWGEAGFTAKGPVFDNVKMLEKIV